MSWINKFGRQITMGVGMTLMAFATLASAQQGPGSFGGRGRFGGAGMGGQGMGMGMGMGMRGPGMGMGGQGMGGQGMGGQGMGGQGMGMGGAGMGGGQFLGMPIVRPLPFILPNLGPTQLRFWKVNKLVEFAINMQRSLLATSPYIFSPAEQLTWTNNPFAFYTDRAIRAANFFRASGWINSLLVSTVALQNIFIATGGLPCGATPVCASLAQNVIVSYSMAVNSLWLFKLGIGRNVNLEIYPLLPQFRPGSAWWVYVRSFRGNLAYALNVLSAAEWEEGKHLSDFILTDLTPVLLNFYATILPSGLAPIALFNPFAYFSQFGILGLNFQTGGAVAIPGLPAGLPGYNFAGGAGAGMGYPGALPAYMNMNGGAGNGGGSGLVLQGSPEANMGIQGYNPGMAQAGGWGNGPAPQNMQGLPMYNRNTMSQMGQQGIMNSLNGPAGQIAGQYGVQQPVQTQLTDVTIPQNAQNGQGTPPSVWDGNPFEVPTSVIQAQAAPQGGMDPSGMNPNGLGMQGMGQTGQPTNATPGYGWNRYNQAQPQGQQQQQGQWQQQGFPGQQPQQWQQGFPGQQQPQYSGNGGAFGR